MRRWLARHLFYPAQDALQGRDSLRYARQLEASQYWTAERLQELQDEKLRRLLKHAVDNCPYYRRRLQGAGSPPAAATSERFVPPAGATEPTPPPPAPAA